MGDDGGIHVTIADVPHYIELLLLIVLMLVLLVAGALMLIEEKAPIPEQLREDIIAEQLKTCLSPELPMNQGKKIGYIETSKLTPPTLFNCVGENKIAGVYLTTRTDEFLYEVSLPGISQKSASRKHLVTLQDDDGTITPAFMEVLFP